jgi:hypothetical protein
MDIKYVMNTLTPIEKTNLTDLEATIEKHLSAFYEVGFALMQIRDNKYYRETHSTFEQYCKERWGFSKTHANRLIASSEVSQNLTPTGVIPQSERVVRPLTQIKDPEQQRKIYQKAVETAPDGKVTAKHIEDTVRRSNTETEIPDGQSCPESDAMTFMGYAISQLERIRDDDPLRQHALKTIIEWCHKNYVRRVR